jgi:MoaA/NifB/PqqE/SkfB family radical SAM enzyme
MSLSDMESVAKIIRDIQIAEISFFNLGESCLSDRFHLEVDLLRKYNPGLRIYMSTNGALIDTPEKVRAAMEFHHILFSIDGPSQDILVKYQVGGNFDKSYGNMKKVIDERNRLGKKTPTIEWKYVVFNWNDKDDHINRAIELAKEAGVDLISFMSGGAPDQYLSKRYKSSAFFRNLGQPSWRGREIWFEYKDAQQ